MGQIGAPYRINRNIMEFKVSSEKRTAIGKFELIET